jgi:hypothetical protein
LHAEARIAKFRVRICLEALGGEYPAEQAPKPPIARYELPEMVEALADGAESFSGNGTCLDAERSRPHAAHPGDLKLGDRERSDDWNRESGAKDQFLRISRLPGSTV